MAAVAPNADKLRDCPKQTGALDVIVGTGAATGEIEAVTELEHPDETAVIVYCVGTGGAAAKVFDPWLPFHK